MNACLGSIAAVLKLIAKNRGNERVLGCDSRFLNAPMIELLISNGGRLFRLPPHETANPGRPGDAKPPVLRR